MPLPSLFSDFFKSFMRLSLKLCFSVAIFLRSKKILLLTNYSLYVLRVNTKFPRINSHNARLLNDWDRTNRDFHDGHFFKSLARRESLLEEADGLFINGEDPHSFFYSHEFGSNIGHLAILALHQRAMNLRLLPEKNLELPIMGGNDYSNFWIPLLFPSLECRSFSGVPNWTELPSNWSFVEKFPIFRLDFGFIDQFSLTEKIYETTLVNKSNRILELPLDYLDRARSFLHSLGLPSELPFIALHIRSGTSCGTRRNQNPSSFQRTVDELIRSGYFVLRIGNKDMEPMRPQAGFIDLSRSPSNDWLHPYVLYEAYMFIGTNSGPTWMSQVFGTPTLMTNATSLARSVLSGCENTLYIPKKVIIRGVKLPLGSLFSHTEGYSELDTKSLSKNSITYIQNDEQEIWAAALELLQAIEDKITSKGQVSTNLRVDQLRNEWGAIAFGKFAASFFEINDWFLD